MNKVVIIGGGASGLMAAAELASSGTPAVLLERLDRVGKKILQTGNGRCNLSNTAMDASHYHYSSFVEAAYAGTPPSLVASRLSDWGLLFAEESGRIYPRTFAASSVLDVLRMRLSPAVTVHTETRVTAILPQQDGFLVRTDNGSFPASQVILAAGGSAAPRCGTDGSGVLLAESLGHHATPCYPGLVQLHARHPALKSLKGMRVRCQPTLVLPEENVCGEIGEVLFTDYGLSGICIFQLSSLLRDAPSAEILLNLLPELSPDSRHAWLSSRLELYPDAACEVLFTGVLPRMLSLAVLKAADIPAGLPVSSLNGKQKEALFRMLFRMPFPITGTHGMDAAQVTVGGVETGEVDPANMASRCCPGLYLTGELLNVDGECGGYNLHFAFTSGLAAARSILAGENRR